MRVAEVREFYSLLAEARPNPEGELQYYSPYTLLVAVVLSAQATDIGVNKATAQLFKVADTPTKMLKLGEKRLKRYIKTIGLYNSKAKNIIALSKQLLQRHGGVVPADRDMLEEFPGVGRKTASVVLNLAFKQPTIAVDTHVYRVSNRTGLAVGKTPLEVEKRLEKLTPDEFKLNAHHWLILHGRYICKARRPDCWRCPVVGVCKLEPKTPQPSH